MRVRYSKFDYLSLTRTLVIVVYNHKFTNTRKAELVLGIFEYKGYQYNMYDKA